jgi:hypothetical protein
MPPNREAAAAALFTRLQNLCGAAFQTYSRAYIDPTTLQPEQQPALMLIAERYNIKFDLGKPPAWLLYYSVLLYSRTLEADPSPETLMNALINSVENAVQRQANEPIIDQTNLTDTNLGGLVKRVSIRSWIVTTGIELMAGAASGQSAAIIPLEVLITQ